MGQGIGRSRGWGHSILDMNISNFLVCTCFFLKYIFKMTVIFTKRKLKKGSHLIVCEKPRVRLRTLDAHLGKQKFYIIFPDVQRPQGLKIHYLWPQANRPEGGSCQGEITLWIQPFLLLLVGPFEDRTREPVSQSLDHRWFLNLLLQKSRGT